MAGNLDVFELEEEDQNQINGHNLKQICSIYR